MSEQTETKTWKQTLGTFLTKKGLAIGGALVAIGGVLEGATDWVNAIVDVVKAIFG